MIEVCECGEAAWCKKSSECKRCYFRRYRNEQRLGQSRKQPPDVLRRSCSVCGTVFVPSRATHRFCSRSCSTSFAATSRWASLDPAARSALRLAQNAQRAKRGRKCKCGHTVPHHTGPQLGKCNDCIGLVCKWDGCSTGVPRNRSWCADHRIAIQRIQSYASRDKIGTECSETECVRPVRARGVCNMHYKRILRSEGRLPNEPWDERRRNNYYIRKTKMDATTAAPVILQDIIDRDGTDCALCFEPVDFSLKWPAPFSKSLDHILPISRGGSHTLANCQIAHLRCNISKGARVA